MGTRPTDDIEPAHLRDATDRTFSIARYEAPPHLSAWLRRFWIPVWDVPEQRSSVQSVLQHPVCIAVTTPAYSRLAGPDRGISRTELRGRSWALGLLFAPAAGVHLAGGPVGALTDGWRDLDDVPIATGLTSQVRDLMTDDPLDEQRHARVRSLWEERLERLGDPDEESLFVNEIVGIIETDRTIRSVAALSRRLDISERSLQRLTVRRLGLSPAWLVRRRRLHEASARLRWGSESLAEIAAELGYADQAHFSRDIRTVTGMTPRQIMRRGRADQQTATERPAARA